MHVNGNFKNVVLSQVHKLVHNYNCRVIELRITDEHNFPTENTSI